VPPSPSGSQVTEVLPLACSKYLGSSENLVYWGEASPNAAFGFKAQCQRHRPRNIWHTSKPHEWETTNYIFAVRSSNVANDVSGCGMIDALLKYFIAKYLSKFQFQLPCFIFPAIFRCVFKNRQSSFCCWKLFQGYGSVNRSYVYQCTT
jgi:hypothetical protein